MIISGVVFQSTLPVWGGTPIVACGYMMITMFQSTLPVWGGTTLPIILLPAGKVSIHPPRVGRDLKAYSGRAGKIGVSIHPPRVGRDLPELLDRLELPVSIHPPRVGRDEEYFLQYLSVLCFNPPSPCGEGLFPPRM